MSCAFTAAHVDDGALEPGYEMLRNDEGANVTVLQQELGDCRFLLIAPFAAQIAAVQWDPEPKVTLLTHHEGAHVTVLQQEPGFHL